MSFEVAAGAYERFMGRFSRPLAAEFSDWLQIESGQRVLDVGCGPGQWTVDLVGRVGAEAVTAVDPSEPFVAACKAAAPGVDVRRSGAVPLPFDDDTFDVVGSNLVVTFMPDPWAGMTEAARVTVPGGVVAATVWDLAGGRPPMAPIWHAFADVGLSHIDETMLPGSSGEELRRILADSGLRDVQGTELTVSVVFETFDDWWEPYQHGVGPIGESVASITDEERRELRRACLNRLGHGPFEVPAVANAARGRV
ncbi:methyltransferase domain-containing protein [Gordonia sp. ABSL1-1]|uniref:class I SAM-dependent methyltransferase n=1 Tax=Gordonia sp. ABSL1-1 TaxID=3053923 RepID=UPI00257253CF|nr:methyltransferase domain-containing protein [Gordonia sp. ABSL1-1]MDL9935963.1 methyltransferase domain-containing protein [Gordonia sp. ABSL1-1]